MSVDGPAAPLIVDWSAHQRADLEVAMREGVAVVAYDAKGLVLLEDCHIDGKYGFIGVSTKENVVRLESADEIRANLPLSGSALAAQLGGELQRGTTLDVALVLIGKRRTTWRAATTADLIGSCSGATHFVRGAEVGAFAMDTGARAEARLVAEVFKASAHAESTTKKKVHSTDGLLTDCKQASPESAAPAGQCAALLRIELRPIGKAAGHADAHAADAKTDDKPEHKKVAVDDVTCPQGMVLSEGKCAKAAEAPTHVCRMGDAADCTTQCDRGDAASCDVLGVMLDHGDGVPKDPKRAAALFAKACDKDFANGCANLGLLTYVGAGAAPSHALAAKLFAKACSGGVAQACTNLGNQLWDGDDVPKNVDRAAVLFNAACNGGDYGGCTNLGVLYMSGTGVPHDDAHAVELFKRACDGGEPTSCGNTGVHYEFGLSVPKNTQLAARFFDRSCRMQDRECLRLAILHQIGNGVAHDEGKARELYERACAFGNDTFGGLSCVMLVALYGQQRPRYEEGLRRIYTVMGPQCDVGVARACAFYGVAALGLGEIPTAAQLLNKACTLQDPWACDIKRRLGAR